jgi:hypothetical protein
MDHLVYMERCPTHVGIKKYLEALLYGDNYDGFGHPFLFKCGDSRNKRALEAENKHIPHVLQHHKNAERDAVKERQDAVKATQDAVQAKQDAEERARVAQEKLSRQKQVNSVLSDRIKDLETTKR